MATAPRRGGEDKDVAARNGYSNGNGAQFMPWIAVGVSVISAFWTVANPRDDIKSLKADNEYRITELRREVQGNYLTIAEHKEFVKGMEKTNDRLDMTIRTLQADQVPRSEHKQHWDEQADKVNALRDQLIALAHDFAGGWNIGKQLDLIQREIDELRNNEQPVQSHVTVTSPLASPPPMRAPGGTQ